MKTKARKVQVKRLYRLYNIEQSRFGQPFCLCDFHYMAWTPPVTCIVEKIAERALWPCNGCDDEAEIERE